METSITEAELAERVMEIVDRVRQGEQFVIVRDGEAVAVLGPTHPKLSGAMQEVADRLRNIVSPEDNPATDPEAAPS